MAKNITKKASKKSKNVGRGASRTYTGGVSSINRQPNARMAAMIAYDNMIRDPCGAAFAAAPYGGTESGYLARTVDTFQPSQNTSLAGLVTGQTYPSTYILQYTPSSYGFNTGVTQGASSSSTGVVVNFANTQPGNFMGNAFVVKKYRPVAACLKWIPTGPYSTRQGVVGLGYAAGRVFDTAGTPTGQSVLQSAMSQQANGSVAHEIRWLPTTADQVFSSVVTDGSGISYEGGCVFASLVNIDSVALNATSWVAQGYFEITTIWEWVPRNDNAANGSLTTAPRPPPPFSINDHQSTITDIGQYLLYGLRQGANYAAKKVVEYAPALLTGGVKMMKYAAPSLPLLLA